LLLATVVNKIYLKLKPFTIYRITVIISTRKLDIRMQNIFCETKFLLILRHGEEK